MYVILIICFMNKVALFSCCLAMISCAVAESKFGLGLDVDLSSSKMSAKINSGVEIVKNANKSDDNALYEVLKLIYVLNTDKKLKENDENKQMLQEFVKTVRNDEVKEKDCVGFTSEHNSRLTNINCKINICASWVYMTDCYMLIVGPEFGYNFGKKSAEGECFLKAKYTWEGGIGISMLKRVGESYFLGGKIKISGRNRQIKRVTPKSADNVIDKNIKARCPNKNKTVFVVSPTAEFLYRVSDNVYIGCGLGVEFSCGGKLCVYGDKEEKIKIGKVSTKTLGITGGLRLVITI